MPKILFTIWKRLPLILVLSGLLIGAALHFLVNPQLAQKVWGLTTLFVLIPLLISVGAQFLRKEFTVDFIALFAMGAALYFGYYLAGAVVGLMLSGGQALEAYALARAQKELTALVQRVPTAVHRYEGTELKEVSINEVKPGDLLLVKPGNVIPVDGIVEGEMAVLDESALTGESRLRERQIGEHALSGVINAGSTFNLRAVATAEKSTYAGIVRLVKEAQTSKAPFVRLADRYALIFVPLTLIIAAAAWFFSGDPVRMVAVMVVATPCPLILAAPVAFISGISRAAKRGIIVKGADALEALADVTVLLLDKTGTITKGMSVVSEIMVFDNASKEDLLQIGASLDQVSPHVLASAIVLAAREQKLTLKFPTDVQEIPGSGIRGKVGGKAVEVGKAEFLFDKKKYPAEVRKLLRRSALEGFTNVFITVEGKPAGAFIIEDPIRTETPRTVRLLRRMGIKRVVTVTGDHPDLAESIGAAIGADEVLSERSPSEKVEAVLAESQHGKTAMVGDGINDAPALAAADIGIAMGVRGATASSEAADIVLMVDRLDRLAEALKISKRTKRIAVESIAIGMGLSFLGMGAASMGWIQPVAGALFQEVIDVLVILNALRALAGEPINEQHLGKDVAESAAWVREEHEEFMPEVKHLRQVADQLDIYSKLDLQKALDEVRDFLLNRLLPHENAEDEKMYPIVSKIMGGDDPTATMSRAHLEISHLIRLYVQLLEHLPHEGPTADDLRDLRRILYGLHTLLKLHFAQEDEQYLALIEERLPEKKGVHRVA